MGAHLVGRNERLSVIEQLLLKHSGGLRVVEIAEHCEVDRRTIYRDLTILNENGVPVYHKNGRFFINRDYYLSTMRLNVYETVSLFFALRIIAHHQDQPNPHIISLMRKLAELLPSPVAQHSSTVTDSMSKYSIDRAYVSVLETLIRGWGDRRIVKLWDGKITREFAVYFIEPSSSGSLIVVGVDTKRDQNCMLRLRRVKRAKITKTPYEIPANFDRLRHLSYMGNLAHEGWEPNDSTKMEEVKLIFSAENAMTLKQKLILNPSQIKRLDDGKYLISLYTDNWFDLLPLIRSWGAQVEVLSPLELRKQIASEAAHLLSRYQE